MKGYIKDFRKELKSDIWLMPPLYHRVWQYLKYMVNHKPNKIPMKDGSFLTVEPGQHLTSIRNIAEDVAWYERGILKKPNPKTISNILDWLVQQGMLDCNRGLGNRQYTLITLSNWDLYQSNEDEGNAKVTVNGYESKQSADINKNEKNVKNEKNITAADSAYEESTGGVPTTENVQLADADQSKGQIPGSSDYERIRDYYMQLAVLGGFDVKPKDQSYILELLGYEVDVDKVLEWLKGCFDDFKPKHPRDKINSFGYCLPIILDKHFAEKEGVKHVNEHRRGSRKTPTKNDSITGGQVGWLGRPSSL